ncbi:MAG: 1-acyl-sn-glycerol-3-phosphate acyltransferase, partial [Gammaproteobacteria bacterium]|nr:1-acyl-sn-glycerol-3-phosphate acyltransferase [Gammaproteobacteria bacterium]
YYLRHKTRDFCTVRDVQLFLSQLMERIVRDTIHELTVDGLDRINPDGAYLYISNHRDIVMDSSLLNLTIYLAGHSTCRIAVGDNLLTEVYAADLMRLNKSFVVERSATGTRAMYQAMLRTSSYIRHSLEEGESVWIAQREGRAKDGIDRTDPALLKMIALAYRKETRSFADNIKRMTIVPVSVSYELDPCDHRKAHELYLMEKFGGYDKPPNEDLESIVEGIVGYKGRVHLTISEAVTGNFEDPESLAREIDLAIVGGMKVFPTHVRAAYVLNDGPLESAGDELPDVSAAFAERLLACPEEEKRFLLAGYGNLLRNRETILRE